MLRLLLLLCILLRRCRLLLLLRQHPLLLLLLRMLLLPMLLPMLLLRLCILLLLCIRCCFRAYCSRTILHTAAAAHAGAAALIYLPRLLSYAVHLLCLQQPPLAIVSLQSN
jgi:hypothetical protein